MRPEKNLLMDDVKTKISHSKALLIMSYKNLDANETANFRTMLAQTGGILSVVKKRVFLKAAKESGFSFEQEKLEGHIGIVFSGDDAVETTKSIFKFKKTKEEAVAVLGGQFEGQLCTAKDFELISNLPTKEQMRSQLLSVFEAPLSQTLATMEALLTSVVFCLDNKANAES